MIRVLRETKETPPEIEERVTRAGGWNAFGEPNFRVVWGWSRLEWIGGRWLDRDASGNLLRECVELRREPKYFPHDRWHIERWMPAETYGSPDAWYACTLETEDGNRIPALGPYPRRGEYEHCLTLAGPRGEFISLTPAAAEYIVRAIEWARRQPRRHRRRAFDRACEQREWEANHAANAALELGGNYAEL